MIRRPPRSTQSRSSAASDVYKRQHSFLPVEFKRFGDAESLPMRTGASLLLVASKLSGDVQVSQLRTEHSSLLAESKPSGEAAILRSAIEHSLRPVESRQLGGADTLPETTELIALPSESKRFGDAEMPARLIRCTLQLASFKPFGASIVFRQPMASSCQPGRFKLPGEQKPPVVAIGHLFLPVAFNPAGDVTSRAKDTGTMWQQGTYSD